MTELNFRAGLAVCVLAAWCGAPLYAQQVPPGATPGGALPQVQPAVPPAPRAEELFSIPRVFDRPLGLDEGPRLLVTSFRLVGAEDRPQRGVRVAEVEALLEEARKAQPAEGFTINQLQEVAGRVAAYYREHGFILAQSFVPAQNVVGGQVNVEVLEGRLSGVVVEGNKHYSSGTLLRPFTPLIGAPVDKDSIESALLTLTNYPGITAFGVLGAGKDVGTTNLTLRVQSEKRFQLDTAVDNHGSQFAGEYRGQVTATVNDLLGRADRLQVTGLYAFDSGEGQGFYGGVDYEIPLFSARDSLRFSHLTNAYDVGGPAVTSGAESDGRTRIDEIGYRHDFSPTRLGSTSIGLAVNVKHAEFRTPPTTLFEDDLTTARLDFQWERVDTRFRGIDRVALSVTHGFNDLLGSLDEYDPAATGGASRLGASGQFDKITLKLQRLQRLTRSTSLVLRADAQFTDDPLVSLEQFSLGGPEAVRAYPTAEILAEKGVLATIELLLGAPGFANRPAFGSRTWGQVLQISMFADYGNGKSNDPLLSAQAQSVDLAGAGVAIQLSIPGRVFARIDVASPLNDREASNGRDPQYYFRFGMSF
jgi:hemolysin activation/secretion protein